MVAYADKAVGQIVAQLEKSGVRDNTLIIFTGDNGTDTPIVTPWNGTKVVGGKGTMSDTGTRVPLITSWPGGIQKPGRVVDDLVEFTDMFPTLCEVTGAKLPKDHPNDGASIVPILKNKAETRTKDWIYIWYRKQVMVRNKQYSLVANQDGTGAALTRYKGSFDGNQLKDDKLTKTERALKAQFEAKIAELAKTRLTTASEEGRKQGLKNKTNR